MDDSGMWELPLRPASHHIDVTPSHAWKCFPIHAATNLISGSNVVITKCLCMRWYYYVWQFSNIFSKKKTRSGVNKVVKRLKLPRASRQMVVLAFFATIPISHNFHLVCPLKKSQEWVFQAGLCSKKKNNLGAFWAPNHVS